MRAVLQRVSKASVTVGDRITGETGPGFLVLLGVEEGDTTDDVAWLVGKILPMRVFEDDDGRMNRSLRDTGGGALVVSQFTLHARTKKGTRPSFDRAARPDVAIPLYERFVTELSAGLGKPVATGEFGAMMKVALVNDGPVTILLDSRVRE
ncbi:MAG: D-tyrosyl-tRNA(Tyr) deacylase [Verrucomicrobia bacterium]|jgi:D-tyrosyl-tRNA(Tyr) deacylase|nr:D-tyrosyl-tRNA(Tyr) deacylase [Verrucomicrobiota bacterium]